MGAERSLLLPDAYPVYFARVSRSGRVRHAIRIPEANQDFATCLEVPLKTGRIVARYHALRASEELPDWKPAAPLAVP